MAFAALSALVGIVIASIGFRRRALVRIAWANFRSRPSQTALIVVGLLVASLVIAASLVAADSTEALFTESAYRGWGPIDIRVGTLAGHPFPEEKANEILQSREVRSASDGGAARLSLKAAVSSTGGESDSRVGLIGIDFDTDASLGPLNTRGDDVKPGIGEVVINSRLAGLVKVEVGDQLAFSATNPIGRAFSLSAKVISVVPDLGKADYDRLPNAFVDLSFLQTAGQLPMAVNQIVLSAPGGVRNPRGLPSLEAAVLKAAKRVLPTDPNDPAGQIGLSVVASKAASIEEAQQLSLFLRAILTMLGSIVALASIALIGNLFVMLGQERRWEQGTMRALGLKRSELVFVGIAEGAVYAMTAAVLGSGLGILFGGFLGKAMADIWAGFVGVGAGELVEPEFTFELTSLITAAGAGFMISIVAVGFVSYRTSRMAVVSAIRNLPEERIQKRRTPRGALAAIAAGVVLAIPLIPPEIVDSIGGPEVAKVIGVAFAAFGGGALISRYVNRRLGMTLGAGGATAFGIWAHAGLDPGFNDPGAAFAFIGAVGVVSVVSAVALISANLTSISTLARLLRRKARIVVRMATAFASGFRLRSGLSIGMFALVLYMIAAFSVWGAFGQADFEEQSGGFDVFVITTVPPGELKVEGAESVIGMTGGNYRQGYTVGDSIEIKFPIQLYGIDQKFVDENRFALARKQSGLSDQQGWQQLLDAPGTVILDANSSPGGTDLGDEMVIKTDRGPKKLQVVGVAEEFLFTAAFMSKQTLVSLFPAPAADAIWLIRLEPGQSPATVSQVIDRDYQSSGARARPLREIFDDVTEGQSSFIGLFQLLLLLGLVVGISSLAIVALRTVLERRHAIGVLRALGFSRRMIAWWLIAESLLLSTLGMFAGAGIGLVGAYLVITLQIPEVKFAVDWSSLILAVSLVYSSILLFTTLPALKAARLAPAEAVRYVE